MRLREAQDESGGWLCFIPLEYQLGTTMLVDRHASPIDDLRTLATSRLMLDNFPHIKSYWVMSGESTASIGLNFGADDLDGTIGTERIAHAAHAAPARSALSATAWFASSAPPTKSRSSATPPTTSSKGV